MGLTKIFSSVKNSFRESNKKNDDSINYWINRWICLEYKLGLAALKHFTWIGFLILSVSALSRVVGWIGGFGLGFLLMLIILGGFTNVLTPNFFSWTKFVKLIVEVCFWLKYDDNHKLKELTWLIRVRALLEGVLIGFIACMGFLGIFILRNLAKLSFKEINYVIFGISIILSFLALSKKNYLHKINCLFWNAYLKVFYIPVWAFFAWFFIVNGFQSDGNFGLGFVGFIILAISFVGDDFFIGFKLGNSTFQRWRTVFIFCFFVWFLDFSAESISNKLDGKSNVKLIKIGEDWQIESFCQSGKGYYSIVLAGSEYIFLADSLKLPSEQNSAQDDKCA